MLTELETTAIVDADEGLVRTRVAALIKLLEQEPHTPAQAWGATFDAGLSRVSFPEGCGGSAVRPELQSIVDDALAAIGVPSNFNAQPGGIGVVAPALARFASPQQQARYLRRLFTCEEFWCQLFSEPDAGSDLPALRSTVVRDGDSWILNGHKVWTSMAHIAQHGLLLARSTPGTRHEGITAFILDMSSPGIEIRPLRQLTGDAEFNEVFFTDVVVPDANRIGDVDGGWRVAIGTLMEERNAVNHVLDNATSSVDVALGLWRSLPEERKSAQNRDRLVDLWVRWEANEMMRARGVARQKQGEQGPEGSLVKLGAGNLNQGAYEFCVDLLGADGMLVDSYAMTRPASQLASMHPANPVKAFLRTRAATIEGGTNEVQRNTIAERVLGLPREPRP
jgi:alkylation response protein AidB-like acyl-CoA dehydrogenase